MLLSIIIPVLNECDNLKELLPLLRSADANKEAEIIVVDAGQCVESEQHCKEYSAQYILSPIKSRASQQNLGAKNAKGQILYFVHADTRPPKSFIEDIKNARKEGYQSGCYRFKFDSDRPLLKFNSYCTRFYRLMLRGGDQTLFIDRPFFEKLGGFDEYYSIMEEYPLIRRLMKQKCFVIMPNNVLVSARKYDHNSYLKINLVNFSVFMMFYAKVHPDKMKAFYGKWIK